MQVKELKKKDLDLHVEVIIPSKDINAEIQKELTDISKNAKMPGFRPGKVPPKIIERKYGQSVKSDVLQHKVNHAVNDVIKDKKLEIAGDPKISDSNITDLINGSAEDLKFKLEFEILPEIKMPDFKKISLEKPVLKVDAKDVTEQLEKFAHLSKTYDKEKKGKAEMGDQVTLNSVGSVDGEEFDGGKLENHKLVLGSKQFIDSFEDQLVGSKAGDKLTVKVTFPKEYHAANLAGKKAEFATEVVAVHKAEEPKMDDEFAKNLQAKDMKDLKERISQTIAASFDESVHTVMKMHLFDKLDGMLKFDLPKSMLDKEYESLKAQAEYMKNEDESLKDKSEKDLEKDYQKLSERRVRVGLLLSEYVKKNDLKIEQDDVRKAVMNHARQFPGQEQMIFDYYQKNPKALEALKGPILEEKAVREIFEKEVKISEKKYSKKDLEKFLEKESSREGV